MFDPDLRRRLRAAVSAVLVSGHEHAPPTRRPAASVPEQEADRSEGRVGVRAAKVLSEVTDKHTSLYQHDFITSYSELSETSVPKGSPTR